MSLPAEIELVLTDALDKRNFLAHRFFRHHANTFTHDRGRIEMIGELQQLAAFFQKADALATPLYMTIWKKFGVDEAWVEREIAEARRETASRYAGL
jgi:hypothetical protein